MLFIQLVILQKCIHRVWNVNQCKIIHTQKKSLGHSMHDRDVQIIPITKQSFKIPIHLPGHTHTNAFNSIKPSQNKQKKNQNPKTISIICNRRNSKRQLHQHHQRQPHHKQPHKSESVRLIRKATRISNVL